MGGGRLLRAAFTEVQGVSLGHSQAHAVSDHKAAVPSPRWLLPPPQHKGEASRTHQGGPFALLRCPCSLTPCRQPRRLPVRELCTCVGYGDPPCACLPVFWGPAACLPVWGLCCIGAGLERLTGAKDHSFRNVESW